MIMKLESPLYLKPLAKDKYIHIYIKKGIYGLKQAAILVFDNFVRKISSHGYKPVPNIIGI